MPFLAVAFRIGEGARPRDELEDDNRGYEAAVVIDIEHRCPHAAAAGESLPARGRACTP